MAPLTIPKPNPETPEGLAFLFTAGMVDPRPGRTLDDRQPMMILQSMAPTAKLFWDLGVRWHPDLATKWITGGGQFSVAQVVDEKPEEPTIEKAAEEMLNDIAKTNPDYAKHIRTLRESGSPEQIQTALKQLESQIKDVAKMADYIKGKE